MSTDAQQKNVLTREDANAELKRRAQTIAEILEEESINIGSVEEVSLSSGSIGRSEVTLRVHDGGPEKRFDILLSGDPTAQDQRMTVKASYGRELRKEIRNYSEDHPKIGVSVLSRDVETVARDIDRRLLPDAVGLYNRLRARLRKKKKREERRASIAEQISEATTLTLEDTRGGESYYYGRVHFEREEPSDSHITQGMVEPELAVRLETREKLKLTIDNLSPEETIALVNAAEDIIDGPVRQEAPHNRK